MKKGTILYGAACFMLGAAICGGGAAYAAGVMAERSTNTFYVDGKQVELPAYLIGGSNYIKLRDVGEVVGFNVYWDEANRAVQVESDRPHTGVAPEEKVVDDAGIANSAIFTDAYTREAYNAIRQAIVTGRDSTSIPMSPETKDTMQAVLTVFGSWPVYHLKTDSDGRYFFTPYYPEAFQDAAGYCKPFIDSLAGKSDAEKVRQIAFYVCDRLTYKAGVSPTPSTVLVSDSVKQGNCMAYAHNFMFLCGMADMDSPVKIDEGLYMETKFDTESLLYVLKERILKPVGYDCEGILIQCRDPEQTMSVQQQCGGPTMMGQSM